MRYLLALLLASPVAADEPSLTLAEAQEMFKAYQDVRQENLELSNQMQLLIQHIQKLQSATNCV